MKSGKLNIRPMAVVGGLLTVCVIVALCVVAPFFTSRAPQNAIIYIPCEASNASVADSLNARLGEKFGSRVAQILSLSGVEASRCVGAYRVDEGASVLDVARTIKRRNQASFNVTFNNVRTLDQWAERVSGRLMMTKDDLLAVATNPDFCAELGFTVETLPAMLHPDTYEFYWTVTPEDLLRKFQSYYNRFWTEERKTKAQKLGLTPIEVAIVGSIAEEETAKRDERGKVGRLYINRCNIGMPLQADPTVKFAIGDFSIRRITGAMTKFNSPYNTYTNAGLPPGPIRLVEKATIDAILDSSPSNYIYMCARPDFSGYHNFSANYAEHMRNAAAYHRALNARGIH